MAFDGASTPVNGALAQTYKRISFSNSAVNVNRFNCFKLNSQTAFRKTMLLQLFFYSPSLVSCALFSAFLFARASALAFFFAAFLSASGST